MSSNAKGQPKAGPVDLGKSKFDPTAWLKWAERCGYRIYLSEVPSGDRSHIVTEAPCRPKSADDLALWHEFQGCPRHSRANRAALIAHLIKIGRVGQRDGKAGKPSKPEMAAAKRPQPKPGPRSAPDDQ